MINLMIEALEDRRLLSAVHPLAAHLIHPQNILGTHFAPVPTVQFSAAPAAVKAGLDAIAPSAISDSQTVYVHSVNSTTTYYGVILTNTSGPKTRLIVDENGLPAGNQKVAFGQLQNGPANDKAIATALQKLAPSGVTIGSSQAVLVHTFKGSTIFTVALSDINGSVPRIAVDSSGNTVTLPSGPANHGPHGANTIQFSAAPAAVEAGLQAIAPSGTTISSTQTVFVKTVNSTTTYYGIELTSSTGPETHIIVDENGLPAGNQKVLFSQLQNGPSNDKAIATALQNLAPSGVTIPGSQTVFVRNLHDTTIFTVSIASSAGTVTDISVDSTGAAVTAAKPPTPSSPNTIVFSAAPSAVQAGLQAIAPSGTTISASQSLFVLTLNSTTSYYSLELNDSAVGPHGERLTVDQNGLPVGNEQILYGQLQNGPPNDKAIATALQNLAASGTTIAGTQTVFVRTANGSTTFTVNLTNSNGTTTQITVDSTGTAVSPPIPIAGGDGHGPEGGGIGGFGGHGLSHHRRF